MNVSELERLAWKYNEISRRRRFGGYGDRSGEKSEFEIVRDSLEEWIGNMRFPYFGTLTLADIHSKSCHKEYRNEKSEFAWIKNWCKPGMGNRRTADCHVSGVQATKYAINNFIDGIDAGVIVEEFGTQSARRHFHFMAAGDFEHLQNWRLGDVRLEIAKHAQHAVNYVTKYVMKDWQKNDARDVQRFWIKRDESGSRKTDATENARRNVRLEDQRKARGWCGGACGIRPKWLLRDSRDTTLCADHDGPYATIGIGDEWALVHTPRRSGRTGRFLTIRRPALQRWLRRAGRSSDQIGRC